jgi:hypothetical protein
LPSSCCGPRPSSQYPTLTQCLPLPWGSARQIAVQHRPQTRLCHITFQMVPQRSRKTSPASKIATWMGSSELLKLHTLSTTMVMVSVESAAKSRKRWCGTCIIPKKREVGSCHSSPVIHRTHHGCKEPLSLSPGVFRSVLERGRKTNSASKLVGFPIGPVWPTMLAYRIWFVELFNLVWAVVMSTPYTLSSLKSKLQGPLALAQRCTIKIQA